MGPTGARVLIVDDEKDFCDILFRVVKRAGFTALVAHDGEMALEMVRLGLPDIVLLDVRMPGMDGIEVLKRVKKLNPTLPVLMITAYSGIHDAVEAIKEGAYDYLPKPLDNNALLQKIRKAISERQGSTKKSELGKKSDVKPDLTLRQLKTLMGPSAIVDRLISDLNLVASSNFSVVIQGETGSGKELVAQAIHGLSARSDKLIVPVDCGAIPETLFESEVFGHEKGAFTGAIANRAGKFEMAHGGTLFLDEISNMPMSCQAKLLRAIQEKTFFRVGGRQPITMDVRLIIATNRDLNTEVALGRFSRDLFYRLSEFTIVIQPIRDRKEDVVYLADRFRMTTNQELNKNVLGFSDSALDLIKSYSWPGNVRQLKAAIRRAVLQSDEWVSPESLVLDSEEVTPAVSDSGVSVEGDAWDGLSLKEIVQKTTADVESRILAKVLRKTGGNKAKAARLLQIDYKTIHSKIKQYGIKLYSEEE
ncbi:MAG: sigma-54 dependent transcriptional regulator [Deltaproteobacteria bacterium]|nr:sigma-54 dependent transcriptional regulator [Deltaproteobacteria bacterium]